jgi:hypothetical protein
MATASDVASMPGNPVTPCSFSCNPADWNSNNVVPVVGGRLVAVGNRVGHFVPQGANNVLTFANVPALRSLGNLAVPGLRLFAGQAFFIANDGSQQSVTGVVFNRNTNSVFFYDAGTGKTFYYSSGAIVELNFNQLSWLYSWASGRVCILKLSLFSFLTSKPRHFLKSGLP